MVFLPSAEVEGVASAVQSAIAFTVGVANASPETGFVGFSKDFSKEVTTLVLISIGPFNAVLNLFWPLLPAVSYPSSS